MADNLTIAGVTVATDDVGGVHTYRFKPVTGPDGTVNDVSEANPMPVREPAVSTSHLVTAASANPGNIKSSAGRVRSVYIFNAQSIPIYVKLHDTNGSPTAGTGVVFAVGCQAGVGINVPLPGGGKAFSTGIARTVVAGPLDNDSSAVAAGNIVEICYE